VRILLVASATLTVICSYQHEIVTSVVAASILPRSTIPRSRIEDKAYTPRVMLRVRVWVITSAIGHGVALRFALFWRDVIVLAVLNPEVTIASTDARSNHGIITLWSRARFAVTSFVVVVRLAERVEMHTTSVKVVANIRDVFLKERQLWIRVPNISCNTEWILIAISKARFFSLRSSRLGKIVEAQAVEAAATIVYEFQFFVALV